MIKNVTKPEGVRANPLSTLNLPLEHGQRRSVNVAKNQVSEDGVTVVVVPLEY